MAKNPLSMAIIMWGHPTSNLTRKVKERLKEDYPKHAILFIEVAWERGSLEYMHKLVKEGVRIVVSREPFSIDLARRVFAPHPVRLIIFSQGENGEVVFSQYSLRGGESEELKSVA